jgi:hypothetical protein
VHGVFDFLILFVAFEHVVYFHILDRLF